tara:strand:- start:757 stop:975 length:219 start_codon:yes stop_codon:yes gene_type:complete
MPVSALSFISSNRAALSHKRYRSTLRSTHINDPIVIEQAEKFGQQLYNTVNKSYYKGQLAEFKVGFEMGMSI